MFRVGKKNMKAKICTPSGKAGPSRGFGIECSFSISIKIIIFSILTLLKFDLVPIPHGYQEPQSID